MTELKLNITIEGLAEFIQHWHMCQLLIVPKNQKLITMVEARIIASRMLAADALYDVLRDVRPIIVALKSAYEDVLGEAYDGYLDAIDNALAQADGKWEDEL